MRISVIGAGNVGRALGSSWARRGHQVIYGVREPAGEPGTAAVPAAAADAEVVVLATPWAATQDAVGACGNLAGRIVIDCTNPLRMSAAGLTLDCGFSTSGGEQVAAWAGGASVFKTLNQVGFEAMSTAERFGPPAPVMFVAGDDQARKPVVMTLVGELGFEAVDAGPMTAARLLEPFGMLWIHLVVGLGQRRDRAFALVTPRS